MRKKRTPLKLAIGPLVGIVLAMSSPATGSAQELERDRALGSDREAAIGIELGATPSAVLLEDLDGNDIDLAEFIGGGPTLFEFWAVWCDNCEALHSQMQAAHERYEDRVRFLAIAVAVGQSKRAVRRHLEQHPFGYPTLWDVKGRAVRSFQAPVTSYIVILDEDGRVAYTGAGAEQDIAEAIEAVLEGGSP